jgi:hypothetical protein
MRLFPLYSSRYGKTANHPSPCAVDNNDLCAFNDIDDRDDDRTFEEAPVVVEQLPATTPPNRNILLW